MCQGTKEFITNGKKVFSHTHRYTEYFTESHGKKITGRLAITAIHEFADVSCTVGTDAENGYDYYIVEQSLDLNGEPGYKKYFGE